MPEIYAKAEGYWQANGTKVQDIETLTALTSYLKRRYESPSDPVENEVVTSIPPVGLMGPIEHPAYVV